MEMADFDVGEGRRREEKKRRRGEKREGGENGGGARSGGEGRASRVFVSMARGASKDIGKKFREIKQEVKPEVKQEVIKKEPVASSSSVVEPPQEIVSSEGEDFGDNEDVEEQGFKFAWGACAGCQQSHLSWKDPIQKFT